MGGLDVLAAQSYVQSGRRFVVDVDLERSFGPVNHDILIDRLQKRINDDWSHPADSGVSEQRDHGGCRGACGIRARRKAGHCRRCRPNDKVDKELERRVIVLHAMQMTATSMFTAKKQGSE